MENSLTNTALSSSLLDSMALSPTPQPIQRSPAVPNLAAESSGMPRSLAKSGIWPPPRQQPSRTLGARSARSNGLPVKRALMADFKAPPVRGRGYTPAVSHAARVSTSLPCDEDEADLSMDSGSATPDDLSDDDEEFEVAIDEDCSCAPCRWNLERSKIYPE